MPIGAMSPTGLSPTTGLPIPNPFQKWVERLCELALIDGGSTETPLLTAYSSPEKWREIPALIEEVQKLVEDLKNLAGEPSPLIISTECQEAWDLAYEQGLKSLQNGRPLEWICNLSQPEALPCKGTEQNKALQQTSSATLIQPLLQEMDAVLSILIHELAAQYPRTENKPQWIQEKRVDLPQVIKTLREKQKESLQALSNVLFLYFPQKPPSIKPHALPLFRKKLHTHTKKHPSLLSLPVPREELPPPTKGLKKLPAAPPSQKLQCIDLVCLCPAIIRYLSQTGNEEFEKTLRNAVRSASEVTTQYVHQPSSWGTIPVFTTGVYVEQLKFSNHSSAVPAALLRLLDENWAQILTIQKKKQKQFQLALSAYFPDAETPAIACPSVEEFEKAILSSLANGRIPLPDDIAEKDIAEKLSNYIVEQWKQREKQLPETEGESEIHLEPDLWEAALMIFSAARLHERSSDLLGRFPFDPDSDAVKLANKKPPTQNTPSPRRPLIPEKTLKEIGDKLARDVQAQLPGLDTKAWDIVKKTLEGNELGVETHATEQKVIIYPKKYNAAGEVDRNPSGKIVYDTEHGVTYDVDLSAVLTAWADAVRANSCWGRAITDITRKACGGTNPDATKPNLAGGCSAVQLRVGNNYNSPHSLYKVKDTFVHPILSNLNCISPELSNTLHIPEDTVMRLMHLTLIIPNTVEEWDVGSALMVKTYSSRPTLFVGINAHGDLTHFQLVTNGETTALWYWTQSQAHWEVVRTEEEENDVRHLTRGDNFAKAGNALQKQSNGDQLTQEEMNVTKDFYRGATTLIEIPLVPKKSSSESRQLDQAREELKKRLEAGAEAMIEEADRAKAQLWVQAAEPSTQWLEPAYLTFAAMHEKFNLEKKEDPFQASQNLITELAAVPLPIFQQKARILAAKVCSAVVPRSPSTSREEPTAAEHKPLRTVGYNPHPPQALHQMPMGAMNGYASTMMGGGGPSPQPMIGGPSTMTGSGIPQTPLPTPVQPMGAPQQGWGCASIQNPYNGGPQGSNYGYTQPHGYGSNYMPHPAPPLPVPTPVEGVPVRGMANVVTPGAAQERTLIQAARLASLKMGPADHPQPPDMMATINALLGTHQVDAAIVLHIVSSIQASDATQLTPEVVANIKLRRIVGLATVEGDKKQQQAHSVPPVAPAKPSGQSNKWAPPPGW